MPCIINASGITTQILTQKVALWGYSIFRCDGVQCEIEFILLILLNVYIEVVSGIQPTVFRTQIRLLKQPTIFRTAATSRASTTAFPLHVTVYVAEIAP
ncbi:hypothetical protein LXL04_023479 [Taraxacum kok-saghyz]